jgi:hypothetical protein
VIDLTKLGALSARQVGGRVSGRQTLAIGATEIVLKFTPPTNCATTIALSATVRGTASGAGYGRAATFRRGTGNLTQVGATASLYTLESDAAWDLTIAANGADIEVTATGSASVETVWSFVADLVFAPTTLPGDGGAALGS